MRKCNGLLRKNQRQLDKQLSNLNSLEIKTKSMIKAAAKRGDAASARTLAKELYNVRKHRTRLYNSKAQLASVGMQVNETFAVRKIQGSMKSSTGVMKEVNSLVRLPELTGTMRELSQELMKAGIMDEMVGDTLDTLDEADGVLEEEADAEVDAILSEITGGRLGQAGPVPDIVPIEEPEEVEEEPDLEDMRERLRALQS
ncbi:Snf7 family [Lipomyces tetrasporus]|uniref:Snf7 family n=1 Tax=Lipomyces tetrasporus TaxID=54092 RepID=A0AAD7VP88_9ASCO|nr:Snf7 family [Lipomyces tetrasporus]KAJ8097507.1 Snf7 family [Lipomyces tetrasporus]